jgi:uncharacterized membrane protein
MHSISNALTWPWMQDFVNTYGWIWPLFEIIHYTGMSLIIGLIGALDLRILGLYKGVPIIAFKPLVNLAIFGFVINLIGGIVFVTGTNTGAEFYIENLSFQCKIVAMFIALANLLIFRFSGLEHRVYAVPAGGSAPGSAKAVALVSLVTWVAVIIFGRLLMYNDTLLYFLGM